MPYSQHPPLFFAHFYPFRVLHVCIYMYTCVGMCVHLYMCVFGKEMGGKITSKQPGEIQI